ncbi:MAG: hypothetical protein GWO24_30610 [Akkermansiaceae bacterium]|nr:hypothetical protein [Akkermansiaceae bacterium]
MLPGTLMYVYLGSAAGSLASLAAGTGNEKSAVQWVLFSIGLLATIAITVCFTRIARRALDSRLAGAAGP